MKKQSTTPDLNENAPRPRHISSDTDDVPTMDTPPDAPSKAPASFDRATEATDQEYRAGLLPGSDDSLAPEDPVNLEDDIDLAEGVDPEPYKEFWAERQSFPQQDDPDQEGLWTDQDEEPGSDEPLEPEPQPGEARPGDNNVPDPDIETLGGIRREDKDQER